MYSMHAKETINLTVCIQLIQFWCFVEVAGEIIAPTVTDQLIA